MIHLYANPISTCTRKVLMALLETQTPYELHVIDFAKGEHKQEPHVSRQPFGQVPAIEHDGMVLFESRAICRYISALSGDRLIPATIKERALMDQWSSVEQTNLSPHAMKFIYHDVFKRPQEQAVLDAAGAALEKAFAVLSKPLASQPFLVGDKLTIADIGYVPYLELLPVTSGKATLEKFPHVQAWSGRLRERDSWRKIAGRA
jgi:glutathione S-transferase